MSEEPVVIVGLGILIMGGVFLAYPWTLGLIAVVALVWLAIKLAEHITDGFMEYDAQRQAIADRADRQHHLAMEGDPRGIYGEYPPAA